MMTGVNVHDTLDQLAARGYTLTTPVAFAALAYMSTARQPCAIFAVMGRGEVAQLETTDHGTIPPVPLGLTALDIDEPTYD
ncbi:hypothetical protein AeMF1_014735 [Aphanomyces euteiches]|nr:hypothetical protein AeMF1_014735 [Aphanomyces euteiches]KAH9181385.1 hypothetical protein AeNC1_016639 [Aphanomyces euteiches]